MRGERTRSGLLAMTLGASLLWLSSGSATADTPASHLADEQPPDDVKVVSHEVDYFIDTDSGTVEVTEQILFDHGEDGYPAVLGFPRHVHTENETYAIDYSEWMVARVDSPAKDTELLMSPSVLRLELSEEGEITGEQGYVITYILDNAFYPAAENDVRLVLHPAHGWNHEVVSASASLYGVPGATDILCEDSCQYEPVEDAQVFSKDGGPMRLEVQFPADAGIKANAEEVDLEGDASSPRLNELSSDSPTEQIGMEDEGVGDFEDTWKKIPLDAKILVGSILLVGVVALIVNRLIFARRKRQK